MSKFFILLTLSYAFGALAGSMCDGLNGAMVGVNAVTAGHFILLVSHSTAQTGE